MSESQQTALNAELLLACHAVDVPRIKHSLERGADPNVHGGDWLGSWLPANPHNEYWFLKTDQVTPLMVCLYQHDVSDERRYEASDLLLGAGADPEATDSAGATVLYQAISAGATSTALRLIRDGVEINTQTGIYIDSDEGSPLWIAASRGDCLIAEVLLAAGADPEVESNFGWTPLLTAIANRDNAMVAALIRGGADVDHAAMHKRSSSVDESELYRIPPLLAALDEASSDPDVRSTVEILVDAGATLGDPSTWHPDYIDLDYDTPIWIVKFFLEAGLSPTRREHKCGTLLHRVAAESQALRLLEELLAVEAVDVNVSLCGDDRITPLSAAYDGNNLNGAVLLFQAGASPDVEDILNQMPLIVVITSNGDCAWLALLLDAGANPNIRDDWGRTALHIAARSANVRAAAALLTAGADPDLRDDDGRTALDLARRHRENVSPDDAQKMIEWLKFVAEVNP